MLLVNLYVGHVHIFVCPCERERAGYTLIVKHYYVISDVGTDGRLDKS